MQFRFRVGFATLAVLAISYALPISTTCQRIPVSSTSRSHTNAASHQVRRLTDGHPDLNGFWASSSGPDTPVGATFGPRDPNLKPGSGGAKDRHADPNQPPYKPELTQKVEQFAEYESKYDPAFYCKPGGVPRIGPPHAIIQSPAMPIIFLYQVTAGNTFRIVNIDGRPHNPHADSSYYGDSIGYWDGDTLVIDTNHLNDDTWLGLDGWFHSDALHVIERLTRDADSLLYEVTVDDPNVFTRPWIMNPRTARSTMEQIVENPPCVESDEGHIVDYGLKTTTK
jgi:hypothetical protein